MPRIDRRIEQRHDVVARQREDRVVPGALQRAHDDVGAANRATHRATYTDFKEVLGFDLHSDSTRVVLLVVTVVALAATYMACRAIVESRAGRVMRAIRDAESRTRFLGYPVESFKLWLFVFSGNHRRYSRGAVCAANRDHEPGRICADQLDRSRHLGGGGGRGTLYGAIAGAVLVNYAKTWLTGAFPEVWLFALGALFVVVTLFLPRGIIGLLQGAPEKCARIARPQISSEYPAEGAEPMKE